MASTHMTTHIQNITSQLTMHVTVNGLRVWRVRLAVGMFLMKIAARIVGTSVEFDIR